MQFVARTVWKWIYDALLGCEYRSRYLLNPWYSIMALCLHPHFFSHTLGLLGFKYDNTEFKQQHSLEELRHESAMNYLEANGFVLLRVLSCFVFFNWHGANIAPGGWKASGSWRISFPHAPIANYARYNQLTNIFQRGWNHQSVFAPLYTTHILPLAHEKTGLVFFRNHGGPKVEFRGQRWEKTLPANAMRRNVAKCWDGFDLLPQWFMLLCVLFGTVDIPGCTAVKR